MGSGRLQEVVAHEGSTVITNAARILIWAHSKAGLSFMKNDLWKQTSYKHTKDGKEDSPL